MLADAGDRWIVAQGAFKLSSSMGSGMP